MSVWKKFKIMLKRNYFIFKLMHPIHKRFRVDYMRLAQLIHGVQANKVVFSSYEGKDYSDNPRYISEKLHEMKPDSDIVWLISKSRIGKVKVPDYVRVASPISFRGLREQATARFWVCNFRHTESLYLNTKKQFYIQTWHGDRGFKRVGFDNEKMLREMLLIEDKCSMMIAGSKFGAGTYRTALHFDGEVLMDGCPRNDILIRNDPKDVQAVRARLGLDPDVKVMIYAPTYRDTSEFGWQSAVLDLSRTLDHLESHFKCRWVCVCRAHYLNIGLNVEADPRVMNLSDYPEMAELLLISDMLITDYSSCGGDFALLRRPVFLYHADVEEYKRNCRSFYFDIEQSPFLIAHDQQELEELIDGTDAQKARENCEALDRFFGTTETGHASEAVCKYIIDRM